MRLSNLQHESMQIDTCHDKIESHPLIKVKFSSSGKNVSCLNDKGLISLYNVFSDCAKICEVKKFQNGIEDYSYDHELLASSDKDDQLLVYNVEYDRIMSRNCKSQSNNNNSSNSPVCSIDNNIFNRNIFVTANKSNSITLWDLRNKSTEIGFIKNKDKSANFNCVRFDRLDHNQFYCTNNKDYIMNFSLHYLDTAKETNIENNMATLKQLNDLTYFYGNRTLLKTTSLLKLNTLSYQESNHKSINMNNNLRYISSGNVTYNESMSSGEEGCNICSMDISSSGSYLSTLRSDSVVDIYRLRGGAGRGLIKTLNNNIKNTYKESIDMKWKGDHLALGSSDHNVYVYGNMKNIAVSDLIINNRDLIKDQDDVIMNSFEPILSNPLGGHIGTVRSVDWHPSENIIASVGNDARLILGEI